MQEEQEAQKKHEEKTKREAIYQQYLERKSERENAEEDSRAGISTVQVTNISVLLTFVLLRSYIYVYIKHILDL